MAQTFKLSSSLFFAIRYSYIDTIFSSFYPFSFSYLIYSARLIIVIIIFLLFIIFFSKSSSLGYEQTLFLFVRVRVLDHSILADESFAANVARERLFAGVQTHVTPQVRLVVELLRAHFAFVRFISGVFGQVLLKRRY